MSSVPTLADTTMPKTETPTTTCGARETRRCGLSANRLRTSPPRELEIVQAKTVALEGLVGSHLDDPYGFSTADSESAHLSSESG